MITRQMEAFLKAHEEEAISLLKTIARIPAPSGKEDLRAAFCRDWLTAQGAKGVFIDSAKNVIYPVGDDGTRPLAVFSAHLDVVFPDEEELPIREENGRLFCPGVGDDTACLVCLLMTAKYVAGICETPEWNSLRGKDAPALLFVCNSCEEGLGNLKGIKEICRRFGDRMTQFCSFDNPLSSIVTTAVGSVRYRITVRTEGGHSFSDFGKDNAIAKLSGLITKLYRLQLPAEGHSSYNVGIIEGGTSVNTIAQEASMLFELRSDREASLSYLTEKLEELLSSERKKGLRIDCEVIGIRPCGKELDPALQSAWIGRAVSAVKAVTGTKPLQKSGSTDCNLPLSLGIPSVCIGSYLGKGAHTREEYVELSSLKKGCRIAFEMILGKF